ncbi:aminoglycoside phosphotransferase [Cellulophaga algicola DSM 14237]|uniref:Aminoglycoside phosphotransferase n=1 Tax=Cellulophaga algicola (strain DSM 14237 / IC166 / ACAM 630) TaxID=688270 RepID=E6XB14_CELAD|nr:phosphotransferase [Cellulophaga algicola]ADV48870.1 aminoglycoside phosphotransferase [Cellulophaga algicola DSM 14237]
MIKLNNTISELNSYLQSKKWIYEGETILSVEKPGEGNMNFTLRIVTNKRSFIIKQSRDYVEKYPQVAAPLERVLREAEFYRLINDIPQLKLMMPDLIGLDKENSVMLMDDLGKGKDYSYLYQQGEVISEEDLLTIIFFISKLHNTITSNTVEKKITNKKMRELNHEHIFKYPYVEENGINLDEILPGLQQHANILKQDEQLKKEVLELGKLYLEDGTTLLHGDYFPGSWLKTGSGVRIIDPEFCFFGIAEFEIGVTIAHLKMAEQPEETIKKALRHYKNSCPLDEELCEKFVAIEIIRRIIGLAQLPLEISLEKRVELLKGARKTLLN